MKIIVPEAEEIIDKYFPVLDHGFVALVDYMGGDQSIERAARVSYGAGTRPVSDTCNLIRYLVRKHHTSPLEMCEVTFHIGLPIFVMRQLIRHRTANVNEYSGRYSVMPLMFYRPQQEQISYQSKLNKQGRGRLVDDDIYAEFDQHLLVLREESSLFYKSAIGADISRELARIDLPLSTFTFCYFKIDFRNLLHLIGLRSDSHAQWEIRQFSDVMAGIAKRVAPIAFDAFQDYQQTAVTFTQAELKALPWLFEWDVLYGIGDPTAQHCIVPEGCNARNEFNEKILEQICGIPRTKSGRESREQTEFWDKLIPRPKVDYSLDLSTAKPSSYFEDLVRQHAVEVP